MNTLHKYLDIGIGGINCPCCAPPPGKRRKLFRKARRQMKNQAIQEGLEEYLYTTDNEYDAYQNYRLESEADSWDTEVTEHYEDLLCGFEAIQHYYD